LARAFARRAFFEVEADCVDEVENEAALALGGLATAALGVAT